MTRQPAASVTLVVNPTAGGGRAARVMPGLVAQLQNLMPQAAVSVENAVDYADAVTKAAAVVATAHDSDPERHLLVMVGGDGMAHVGLNACAETDVALGLIPAGSGNDFARGLGIPLDLRVAVQVLAHGTIDAIDLARVRGELVDGTQQAWVGCTVSTGYDAIVSQAANAQPAKFGPLTYPYHALRELARFSPLSYRLTIDGEVMNLRAMMVGISNSSTFGGGMRLAPNADVHDGMLDITIIHPLSRTGFLRVLPRVYRGTHVRHPAVQQIRARSVVVECEGGLTAGPLGEGDGEILGPTPLTVDGAEGALRLIRPRSLVPERIA